MARRKKDKKRAKGIQAKCGHLYIVLSQMINRNGVTRETTKWIATGLSDTPENVKKATEQREKLLKETNIIRSEPGVTIADYIDSFLTKKKKGNCGHNIFHIFVQGQAYKRLFRFFIHSKDHKKKC